MEEEQLKALASQLRQPHGSKGAEMGDLMNESNGNMTRQTINSLDIQDGEELLELGHGNCAHLSYILDRSKAMYYGLEISELMHTEAKQINKGFIEKNRAFFFMYDGIEIPFGENYFDKVFTVNTLYFWDEPEKMLNSIYKVLKPGGVFSIGFAQKSFMGQLPFTKFGFTLYDTDEAEALVAKTEFKILKTETQVERIKGKIGGLIDREFTILTLIK
ncbi:class I SAM-dependent methyltransferase [Cytophaga aurantiaca]|uniref:class I SAM-dependent methyltransferase n=1 Tax=Cytophaga aurantiaca TaxID=29530 RepID=UPI000374BF3F|nr:class I SAM-dependent methyltransferase [Cytophaga aurantiaca]